ncbi:SWI/SNF and RSC complex subunit Ssr4 [Schizosaccharomyces cryophilus OY26]|uniref:SWI/SNF and RSC complex subunit Ssr4 n=1 Tax=Schizosaccharomyces cryophilus (strain OY26 / ATCC MYA-4695 / CBS 11777 / NBRC 106824 / NRRL Y48691) TaxID=653667 RepID=S9W258_SCHCR|nr:SWI/SNF and RSC complex subunit Ssr4 [Schizosaccharomyces cryophilus OY26]EPY54128.1 SWI/SNF and RSC complex subunit Ssr4 [Schizosaccharomyces cryophilus OY26]
MSATTAAQTLLSIPLEYRSQVWCRANLPYPPAPHLPIPAVVDILTKASQALPQITFSWTLVDQPNDGTLFLVWQAPTLPCPPDGMHFMSNERVFNIEVTGKVLEIHEAKHGFFPLSEPKTLHSRFRYRLLGIGFDNYWLVHYIRASENDSVPANISIAKPPQIRQYPLPDIRTPPFLLREQRTAAANIPVGAPIREPSVSAAASQMRARSRTPSVANAASSVNIPPNQVPDGAAKTAVPNGNTSPIAPEDLEIEKGDIMDKLTPQQICTARFIRNTEWMSQILLTLQAAKDIEPPTVFDTAKSLDEFTDEVKEKKAQLKKQDEEYQRLQGELMYTNTISEKLKECTNMNNLEDYQKVISSLEEFAQAKIVPWERVLRRPSST